MTKRVARASHAARPAVRSRARAAVPRSSLKKRVKTFFALFLLGLETAIAAALICGLVIFYRFSHGLPHVGELVNDVRTQTATTIWSQDGVLLGKLEVENRRPVTLSDVASNLINATIAIEDHRFYQHFGLDFQGIARAAMSDLTGHNATRQGASTLTQQLVRSVSSFGLTREKRYSRKIREALLALRVEQLYSKREILTLYLNNVYYGGGAYGVQAAAVTFFGKPASRLDLSEAALLAGLPQRPSAFSPFGNRKAALKRRDEVLDAMQKYGYISAQQCADAKAEHLRFLHPRKRRDYDFKAPYFVWYVLKDLVHRYGADYVYSGLRIQTTLNWKMQRMAETELEKGLESKASYGCNQGCLVSIDNNTGYIRALVGGRNFLASQYDNVTQGKRPPGSTFKLFDYAAAFNEDKCTIDSTFVDEPIEYPHSHGKLVHDFEGWSYRSMTCRDAVAHSINTIAVQVAAAVGINKVIAYAHNMGITTELAPYLPTAIGASAVRPLDLCSAYSLIATKGVKHPPMAIVGVTEPDGTLVEDDMPQSESGILKQGTIDQLTDALEAVVTYGTGVAARGDESSGIVDGAHGKTGTATDFRDAWFAGYTPELTTVVWVASVHHKKNGMPYYAPMPGGQAAVVCAPLWHDFMVKAIPEQRKFQLAQTPQPAQPPAPRPNTAQNNRPKKTASSSRKPGAPADTSQLIDLSADKNAAEAVPDSAAGSAPLLTNPDANPPPTTPGSPSAPQTEASDAKPTGTLPAVPPASTPPEHRLAQNTTTHPNTPAPKPAPQPPQMVDVVLCVDSRERATMWCQDTITVQMTAKKARSLRRCHIHRPPPGAG